MESLKFEQWAEAEQRPEELELAKKVLAQASDKVEDLKEKDFSIKSEIYQDRFELSDGEMAELRQIENSAEEEKLFTQRKIVVEISGAKTAEESLYHQERLAEIYADVIKNVEEKPEISSAEIEDLIDNKADEKGIVLDIDEEIAINDLLEKYDRRQKTIAKTMRSFAEEGGDFNVSELYRLEFGAYPTGEVSVDAKSYALTFICKNPADFNFTYLKRKGVKKPENLKLPDWINKLSKGRNFPTSNIPGLAGAISSVNASEFFSPESIKITLKHESQHALNRFFLSRNRKTFTVDRLISQKTGSEEKLAAAIDYLRERRSAAETYAKDELLAFFAGLSNYAKRPEFYEAPKRMLLSKKSFSYDFLREDRKRAFALAEFIGEENAQKLIQEIFVNEYSKIIESAAETMRYLAEEVKFSSEKIIGFLLGLDIKDWETEAKKILPIKE